MLKTHTLKNGMAVNHVPSDIDGMFWIELIIRRGVIDEDIAESSYSHFVEHLMALMMSKKYNKDIQHMFTTWGIVYNAWTDTRTCGYHLEGLDKYAESLTDIVMNNYVYPIIDDDIFEQEKNAVIRELYATINEPWYNLDSMMNYINYPNTNLALLHEEFIENIRGVNKKQMMDFRRRIYIPSNTVINIVSSKSIDKHLKIINRFKIPHHKSPKQNIDKPITALSLGDNIFFIPNTASPYPSTQSVDNLTTTASSDGDEITNIIVQIDLPFTLFDPPAYIIDFFNIYLTDGLGSHLYEYLRKELGLVYKVTSQVYLDPTNIGISKFTISTETSKKNVPLVTVSILKQLNSLSITHEDLEHYHNRIITSHLNDTSFLKYLNHYRQYLVWNKKHLTIEQVLQLKLNTTTQQLNQLAKHVFVPKHTKIFYSSSSRANMPGLVISKEQLKTNQ